MSDTRCRCNEMTAGTCSACLAAEAKKWTTGEWKPTDPGWEDVGDPNRKPEPRGYWWKRVRNALRLGRMLGHREVLGLIPESSDHILKPIEAALEELLEKDEDQVLAEKAAEILADESDPVVPFVETDERDQECPTCGLHYRVGVDSECCPHGVEI